MGKDYEKMWKKFKAKTKELLEYYQDGLMCSIIESIIGEKCCKKILNEMKEIEKE